jgi:3-phosphoshikimate 1-carboxyvinyltransferase
LRRTKWQWESAFSAAEMPRASRMSLPDLIEIMPVDRPGRSVITIPGSKSITNRALILGALADGEVILRGALWSEDTQVMVDCLRQLGFMVNVDPEPGEPCNRAITVCGRGGVVPQGGTVRQPMDLFVGNAGTAARFLASLLCLGRGVYRLHGIPRMHERPQAALFQALRELGYSIESPNDQLPALIHGGGVKPGNCRVSIEKSSQFASSLLLCAGRAGWRVQVIGENAEESPYVRMTLELSGVFPHRGGVFQVEPDASSCSYFWGAGHLLCGRENFEPCEGAEDRQERGGDEKPIPGQTGPRLDTRALGFVTLAESPRSDWQIDAAFPKYMPLPPVISRRKDLGDSIMTAIVLAPLARRVTRFTDLGRLRVQECERVLALKTELTRCGARVEEEGDTLVIHPSVLHGADIRTYNDHRMAMCFAILGLILPRVRLENPSCVKKTFPNFFQKLATPAPHGLGARVLDASTRRVLEPAGLFAD